MDNNERYEKYIKEYCHNCKNREDYLCEIRVIESEGIVTTKCAFYEKDKEIERPPKRLFRTARQKKPLMMKM